MDGPGDEAKRRAWRAIADPVFEEGDARARRKLGPDYSTPSGARQYIESPFLKEYERLDPRKPDDAAVLRDRFRQRFLSYLVVAIGAVESSQWQAIRLPKPTAEGKPPHPQALAKGVELASFVVERACPASQLVRGDLKPGLHGPYGWPWPTLAEKWNQTHPRGPRYSSEVLRAMYSKAVGKTHVAWKVLNDIERSTTGAVGMLLRTIRQGEAPRATAEAREVREFFGGHTLGDLRELADLVADYTKDYIREERERLERQRNLGSRSSDVAPTRPPSPRQRTRRTSVGASRTSRPAR